MAEPTSNDKVPEKNEKEKKKRLPRVAAVGRSTLPYFAVAIFAAIIMAWYFFVVVPAKLDYFVGLRFRTLAVGAAQVKGKVESLKASLDGGVRPLTGATEAGAEIFAAETARYLTTLVPDLKVARPMNPGLDLLRQKPHPLIPTTVAWADVVAAAADASRRDFDDLILADKDGVVVWQRERTTHRVGKLGELLSTEAVPAGWSLSWQLPATLPKPELRPLNASAVLTPVNVSGHSSYLFVQQIAIADSADLADAPFYLAGWVSSATLEAQARHVPTALVILVALPILLLFLALPFIKLATLTSKERFSFGDILLLGLATLFGISLGVSLLLGPTAAGSEVDETLANLARAIDTRLGEETERVLTLATYLQSNEAEIEKKQIEKIKKADGSDVARGQCISQLDSFEPGWGQRCNLWQALAELHTTTPEGGNSGAPVPPGSLELDIVAWINRDGLQVKKWTTKTAVTTLVSHQSFAHYKDLVARHTWALDGRPSLPRFTVEPLRSPTTAEMGFIFASAAAKRPDRPDHFFVLNVRPQSVVDAVVPPGYGFAVLAADGSVLFHSQEALSLAENFVAEIDRPDVVRGWSKVAKWSGDYHGRPHRLYMQAMTAFVDSPWRIVTFRENEPVLDAQFQQHNAALRLGALNLLALLLLGGFYGLYSAYRHRSLRDFPLTPGSATELSVKVVGGLTVVAVALVAYTYLPGANRHVDLLWACFLALPAIAAIMAIAARHNDDSSTPSNQRRIVEVLLLFVVIGAVPAIGLARIAYCVQDTRDTERWLESARRHWETRRARLTDRVGVPLYSEDTYKLLLGPTGFANQWTPASKEAPEPLYSYLTQIPNIALLPPLSDEDKASPFSSNGQHMVRRLLTWTPTTARNESSNVLSTSDSPQLRLSPRSNDDVSPVFAAALAHGPGTNVSFWRFLLGLLILVASAIAFSWAWRRLTPPSFAPNERLEDQISHVSEHGDEVILLIGPPRVHKDRDMAAAILLHTCRPPAHRVQLLTNFGQDEMDRAIARVNEIAANPDCPAADGNNRLWIHLSNLESQLADADSRKRALIFLESLLDKGNSGFSRVLAITTSIDPIANFEEIFADERQGIYEDAVPEVELNRLSLLLSRFRRCYRPIDCTRKAKDRWTSWLNYDPAGWKKTLDAETHGYEPLRAVCCELENTVWPSPPSIRDLARVISERSQAVYELLWTSCTRKEKLVLIQLAQEGVVNPKCFDTVARLVAKGLVTPVPGLTVFNYTFRHFLRGIERDRVVQEWERLEGNGLWVSAGRIVGGGMVLGGVFFLLTQGISVQTVLPIVSGTGLFGVPVVRDLLAKITNGTGGSRIA